MRVTGVDLYSALSEEAITFSLGETNPTSQYQVKTIVGLDAEELIPKFYGKGLESSSKFYDFSLKPRLIVIRVVLNPRFNLGESPSDVRDELYRTISANRTGMVVLHFRSGGTIVSIIQGSIAKFEVPYFNKLPEAQITVQCNDPMFRAINPVVFEPDDIGVLETVSVPDSLSTAPHGFTMQATFTDDPDEFTIQDVDTDPDWKFKVAPLGGFEVGDVLYISTEYANKQVYIVRGVDTIQLIDRIEPGSIWPIVFPGRNTFYFVNKAAFDWNSLEYYAAYWGV